MTTTMRYLIAATALAGGGAAIADATPSSPADAIGAWTGPCEARGTAATCTSVWTRGKHEHHLVQDYAIVSAADGAQIFAGRGLYRIIDGDVDGIWEYSRGAIVPLAGQFEDSVLRVIWGEVSSEIGRSVYTFEDGNLLVHDAVLTEDGWREFMRVEYVGVE